MNAYVLNTSTIINLQPIRLEITHFAISNNRISEEYLSEDVFTSYLSDKTIAKSSMAVGFKPCFERKLPINNIISNLRGSKIENQKLNMAWQSAWLNDPWLGEQEIQTVF